MSKTNKEDIQTYILTTLLFGCLSLPFISAFRSCKKDTKYTVVNKSVNDSIKTDSVFYYKKSIENQRQ